MAINELSAIVRPPTDPVEAGPESLWDEIQQDLGILLPNDLRDFGLAYGTGSFVEQGIFIFNPFSRSYRKSLDENLFAWKSLRDGEGDREVPFELYPNTPGLLPWGCDDQGAGLFWITEGLADDWPILVRGHEDPVFQRFEMDVTTFISRVMKREILLPTFWPEEIFEDASRLVFQSLAAADEAEAEPRKTVYQFYELNGNQAGFWLKHQNWEGKSEGVGTEIHITSIDGKTQ